MEWETSNSSCSDWLHSTHDIVLANRENPLTHNQALLLYDIRVIPATILYSPDGKVVATQLNGEGLRNKLAEIYDK